MAKGLVKRLEDSKGGVFGGGEDAQSWSSLEVGR